MKSLQEYNLEVKRLHTLAQQVAALAETYGKRDIERQVTLVMNWLGEKDFLVATVGEVSVGKSTFMNALMEQEALPTSLKESTALVTYVKKGVKTKAKLYLNNELKLETDNLDEFNEHFKINTKLLEETASEGIFQKAAIKVKDTFMKSQQGSTAKEIEELKKSRIEIELNNPLLNQQVQIIDTPGLNDAKGVRSQITKEFIASADAAIILFKADKLMSHSELEFFEGHLVNKHIQDIFVVVNRIDKFKTSIEEEEVKQATYERLIPLGIPKENIFFISAKKAFQAQRLAALETSATSMKPIELKERIPYKAVKSQVQEHHTVEDVRHILMEQHQKMEKESYFTDFRKSLEYFLVNNKGQGKIEKVKIEFLESINILEEIMKLENSLLSKSADELKSEQKQRKIDVKAKKAQLNNKSKQYREKMKQQEEILLIEFENELKKNHALVLADMTNKTFTTIEEMKQTIQSSISETELLMKNWLSRHLKKHMQHVQKKYLEMSNQVALQGVSIKSIPFDLEGLDESKLKNQSTGPDKGVVGLAAGATGVVAAGVLGLGLLGGFLLAPLLAVGALYLVDEMEDDSKKEGTFNQGAVINAIDKQLTGHNKKLLKEVTKEIRSLVDRYIKNMEDAQKSLENDTNERYKHAQSMLSRQNQDVHQKRFSIESDLNTLEQLREQVKN